MPRSVEAPVNHNVHSAARHDGNARLMLAELRVERYEVLVFFDFSDETFHYQRSEHRRVKEHLKQKDNERLLLDRFLNATLDIVGQRVKERKFAMKSGVNQTWVTDDVAAPLKRFHPGKIPQRSFLDRYPQFVPDDD